MKTQLFITCLMAGLFVVSGSLADDCGMILLPAQPGETASFWCKKPQAGWAHGFCKQSWDKCEANESGCKLQCSEQSGFLIPPAIGVAKSAN